MADIFLPIVQRVVTRVERLLATKPTRVAAVNVGRGPRVPIDQTSGADPGRRRNRGAAAASMLWDPYEQTRPQRYVDFREMAEEVPELDRGLLVKRDFVFASASQGEHTHELTFGARCRPDLQRVLEQARQDLPSDWAPEVYEEGHRLGDSATELLLTDRGIVGQRYIAPEEMRVEEEDGVLARYWYTPLASGTEGRPLHPFQVLHFAPNKRRGSRYGRSDWAAARGLRRMEEAIQSVLIMLALKKATGSERIFWPFVQGTSQDSMWQHIREVEAELEEFHFDYSGELKKRIAAQLETIPKFIPYLFDREGKVPAPQLVESQAADLVQLLQVIQHFQERYFIVTGTPAALVGMERNVNARSTLVEQGVHFALTVRRDQWDMVKLLTDYYTRCALAAGIVPVEDEFAVSMLPPSSLDEARRAETTKIRSEATANLVTAGVPLRDALVEAFGLSEQRADEIAEAAPMAASLVDQVAPGLPAQEAEAARIVLESALTTLRKAKPVFLDGAARLRDPGNQPPKKAE